MPNPSSRSALHLASRTVIEPLEPRQLFSVPAGFAQETVAGGLPYVSGMAVAPDGRVFITEQLSGKIVVVKNGQVLATPFATLPVKGGLVTGLLGVALDPQFSTNHYVYAFWTASSPDVHDRVSRFTADGDVSTGARTDLIDLPGPADFHQGGMIGFGPDGKLYVPVGDHGHPEAAQLLTKPYGKILRFNKDGTIPTDNPFYSQTTGVNRAIWATGLRNPFQFDFQPGTGRFYINDVGNTAWEEINLGVKGANYGWPGIEGPIAGQTAPANYKDPVYAYAHDDEEDGDAACITGGVFYSGAVFPTQYQGDYFFTDYTAGWMKTMDPANPSAGATPFATDLDYPIDLKRATDGSIYVLQHGDEDTNIGSLVKISYVGTADQPPFIAAPPQDQSAAAGQQVTFTVQAGGPGPLSYQWQRNSEDISGATSSSYTFTAALADDGANYRVVVSNVNGSTTSVAAALHVVADSLPTPTITAPATTLKYKGGQVISFAGSATDTEDGDEPASRFTWSVVFHHDTHTHPFIDAINGVKSGTFTIPTTGETSSNVWYHLSLTVTDEAGLSQTVTRDIYPLKTNVTLKTAVGGVTMTGFALTLDGQPIKSAYTFTGVAGIQRSLGAPASQVVNGVTYDFVGWSDSGAATHNIATPSAATTYTATYKKHTTTGVTRTAIADTYAADGESVNRSLAANNPMVVRTGSSGANRITYLKFDISNLSAVNTAKLQLFARLGSAGSAVNVGLYAVSNTSWTESGLTWNTKPAKGALLTTKSISSTSYTATTFDISAYVKQQRSAGAKFISLALVAQVASAIPVQILPRENSTNKPALVIA